MNYRLIKRNEIVKLREIERKKIIENVFQIIEGELIQKNSHILQIGQKKGMKKLLLSQMICMTEEEL